MTVGTPKNYTGRWVNRLTIQGEPYRSWEYPVPRIPDHFAHCSVYMYSDEVQAHNGSRSGASGFLVHVPSKSNPPFVHVYAVTNAHVIDQGYTTIRLNKRDGGVKAIPTVKTSWKGKKEFDVKVVPVDVGPVVNWWSVGVEEFIDQETIAAYRLGWGDEVFLVGRLIAHDGKQRNAPVVRFGNVSLMADPADPITCHGTTQEGFLVECRSLSGFSGSPVFVTTTRTYSGEDAQSVVSAQQKRAGYKPEPGSATFKVSSTSGTWGPWLLGIDWGHMPLWKPVYRPKSPPDPEDPTTLDKTNYKVEQNTGIACVVPAWRIMEILECDEFVKQREKEDARIEGLSVNPPVNENHAIDDIAREEEFTSGGF